ncbi:DUF5133 domain-containing protein [Streptomyces sp. TRM76323]|uniref:DUF5133 domain-containing protein n=1 Tax=Streptomyces tamarix TaxID=3078565 RepID=A0ABU3QQU8_9ACTN|nr:DUF5133 domain-containing protein [Streptomyces tamarix]MDT9685155.1 DUF5133 domain-containing protein [Streptomyces tamarix]
MLMAHPAVLTKLIEEYTALSKLDAHNGGPEVRQRLEDVAYTLCVSTGTRDIDAALVAARHRLPGARPEDDSLLDAHTVPAARASEAVDGQREVQQADVVASRG